MESSHTRWSVITQMRRPDDPGAQQAWEWFVLRYKSAVQGLLRRRLGAGLARDAEQEFWAYLFQSQAIARAERQRRFRSYLFGIVERYARAWRRGLRGPLAARALADAEQVAVVDARVEQEDLRVWADTVLGLALTQLQERHPDDVRAMCWFYGVPHPAPGTVTEKLGASEIARRLGKALPAIHQVLSRGRARLREALVAQVSDGLANLEDLEPETRLVLGPLRGEYPGLMATAGAADASAS